MGKVTDKPDGLPSGNTVDATTLEDEIDSAYLSLRCSEVKIDEPPALGERVTYVVYGKVVGIGLEERKDGELRPKRVIQITGAHKPGKRPTVDPDQSPLFSVVTDSDGFTTTGDDEDGFGDDE